MWKKFFNARIFWGVSREKLDGQDYLVHVWTNWFLGEVHTVFFPQNLEGNWKELQRRRKEEWK